MTPMMRELAADLILQAGSHPANDGMCVMEAVAFVAGEPHSDHPVCASEVVGAFLRSWNDALPDDESRTRLLRPLVARLVDSRGTPAMEQQRAMLAFDWLIRIYTPKWLDLVPSCAEDAEALRACAPVVDFATADAAKPVAAKAAKTAAAAWAAAGAAAGAAAWAAARDAAGAALAPTRDQLQLLALDLVSRMLDLNETTS
jgi:hypothetical protein